MQYVYFNSPTKGLFKHFQQFSKMRKIKLSKVNNDDLEEIIDGIGQQFYHMELVCIRHSALKSTKKCTFGKLQLDLAFSWVFQVLPKTKTFLKSFGPKPKTPKTSKIMNFQYSDKAGCNSFYHFLWLQVKFLLLAFKKAEKIQFCLM